LQHLLKNFGRTLAPAAPTKGALPVTISVPPTALGTSTAELATLATCSSKLSRRAEMLWPDVSDVQRHSTAKAAEQIRALGWWNVAFALDLAGELLSERSRTSTTFRSELVELLNLVAEAQNAVRVEAEGREVTVAEQDQVFQWMRIICHEHSEGVRIERFMRRDDRANPENNADVSARLHVLGKKIRDRISQERLLRAARAAGAEPEAQRSSAPTTLTHVTEIRRRSGRASIRLSVSSSEPACTKITVGCVTCCCPWSI
jgi:hypothetical protein